MNDKPNKDGKDNYVMFEAEGRGHYVGVTHSILQNQGDWWGEGDEMMFIDNRETPSIVGTGSEDYYLGAWCYGGCGINPFGSTHPVFAFTHYGNPVNGGDNAGAAVDGVPLPHRCAGAFPEVFQDEHRARARQSPLGQFLQVAYWYQQGSHKLRKPLPPVGERIPHLVNVGGPSMGKP